MGRLAGDRTQDQARSAVVRRRVRVTGLVQGVGFRPHVWRLATAFALAGWVRNATDGVTIEVEGPAAAVDGFVAELRRRPPPLARIASLVVSDVPAAGGTGAVVPAAAAENAGPEDPGAGRAGFVILESDDAGQRSTLVSPDIAICEACRREVGDPADRRHAYPFTNCTDCGPRYTIIRGLPYDRPLTSMRDFRMCPVCHEEYDNPADRRFHAQPNACPACGPHVWLEDGAGRVLASSGVAPGGGPEGGPDGNPARKDWPGVFRDLIRSGAIIAVKGLGGFHLACDAHSEDTVARLRARKRRPRKPLAVMARDVAAAARYVRVGPEAERLLRSPAAPIVVLPLAAPGEVGAAGVTGTASAGGPARAGSWRPPAPSLAPGSPYLGLMLAYTPLHLLLFDEEVDLLVMTSGNRSELPIVITNDQARADLGAIADYFLFHDRDIVNRCEDSVLRVDEPVPLVVIHRRSRGYAPAPLDAGPSLPPAPAPAGSSSVGLAVPAPAIFAAGGEMKSAFCVLRGTQAFLSPHLGEMEHTENLAAYKATYHHYLALLDVSPAVVAYDAHPGYLVSRLARELAPGAREVPVYHHHAHLVSCLADNGHPGDQPVLGLVCDGTGYGPDGAVWGGELFVATAASFRRAGHLAYARLPGGDIVARRPFRAAAMHLHRALGPDGVARLARLRPEAAPELDACLGLLENGRGAFTSSAGRLFDAVAALAGASAEQSYEGEAAVHLTDLLGPDPDFGPEPLSAPALPARCRFTVTQAAGGGPAGRDPAGRASTGLEPAVLDPAPFLAAVLGDLEEGRLSGPALAALFHRAFAAALVEAACLAAGRAGLDTVALSGGTFQNVPLTRLVRDGLEAAGLKVLLPTQVPPNDGGLALGQAVAAAWMVRQSALPGGDASEATPPHGNSEESPERG